PASTLDHYPVSANGIREVPRRGPAHAQHALHNSSQGDSARVPPRPKASTHLLLPATTAPEGAQRTGSQGSGQGQRSGQGSLPAARQSEQQRQENSLTTR